MSLLSHLFGDETRIALLRLLQDNPAGIAQRELARKTGRDPAHIHRLLQALDATGVVDAHTNPRAVILNEDSPLHEPVTRTLAWFDELELQTPLLRFTLRAVKNRFKDRFYVGGYQAAAAVVQPIDFRSSRVDIHAKRVVPKDRTWTQQLDKIVPFELQLHQVDRFGEIEETTLDAEPCWTAIPELGVLQCLTDKTFSRYGGFLLLVQGLDEGAYRPDKLVQHAKDTPYETFIQRIVDATDLETVVPPETTREEDRKAFQAAVKTAKGVES